MVTSYPFPPLPLISLQCTPCLYDLPVSPASSSFARLLCLPCVLFRFSLSVHDRVEVVTLPRGAGSVKRSSAAASVPVASILSVDQQQSVAEPTEPLVSQLSRATESQEAGSEEEPESSEAAIGTQTPMEGVAGAGSLASSVRASESVRSLQDRDGAAQGEDVFEAQQLPWDPTQVVVPAAGSSDFAVVAAARASASRAERGRQRYQVRSRSLLWGVWGFHGSRFFSCGLGWVPFWLCEFCSLCVSFASGPVRELLTMTNGAVSAKVAKMVDEWDSPIIFPSLSLETSCSGFHPGLDEGLVGVFDRGETFFW